MSFWCRIEKNIYGGNSHNRINQTSKESISKNPCYNIKINQSHQSSIESSNNQKHPSNFSKRFRVLKIFHTIYERDKEYFYIIDLEHKCKKYLIILPITIYTTKLIILSFYHFIISSRSFYRERSELLSFHRFLCLWPKRKSKNFKDFLPNKWINN